MRKYACEQDLWARVAKKCESTFRAMHVLRFRRASSGIATYMAMSSIYHDATRNVCIHWCRLTGKRARVRHVRHYRLNQR